MQKWDYLLLEYSQTYKVDGQSKQDWNGRKLSSILKELGEQGWELTTAEIHGSAAGTFIFKRPKP